MFHGWWGPCIGTYTKPFHYIENHNMLILSPRPHSYHSLCKWHVEVSNVMHSNNIQHNIGHDSIFYYHTNHKLCLSINNCKVPIINMWLLDNSKSSQLRHSKRSYKYLTRLTYEIKKISTSRYYQYMSLGWLSYVGKWIVKLYQHDKFTNSKWYKTQTYVTHESWPWLVCCKASASLLKVDSPQWYMYIYSSIGLSRKLAIYMYLISIFEANFQQNTLNIVFNVIW